MTSAIDATNPGAFRLKVQEHLGHKNVIGFVIRHIATINVLLLVGYLGSDVSGNLPSQSYIDPVLIDSRAHGVADAVEVDEELVEANKVPSRFEQRYGQSDHVPVAHGCITTGVLNEALLQAHPVQYTTPEGSEAQPELLPYALLLEKSGRIVGDPGVAGICCHVLIELVAERRPYQQLIDTVQTVIEARVDFEIPSYLGLEDRHVQIHRRPHLKSMLGGAGSRARRQDKKGEQS